jgi:superfamily II DNA or RNA helicase
MALEAWQSALRRQFGREQKFLLENVGGQPFFSDFLVTNPVSKSTYRVAIRGQEPGINFCACLDFQTNALGTCKHIEFTLAKLQRRPGGKAALAEPYQPAYSSVSLRYGALREVRFRPGRECPPELARLAARYFDRNGVIRPGAFHSFEVFLSQAAGIPHELRCYEDVLGFVAEVRDAHRRAKRLAEAFPDGVLSRSFKELLKVPLYDYQREGALFAARAGRCLIGDDMGLGKTIQAIAAAEIMARHFGVERVLVICTTSLKHQWEREIRRFAERPAQVIGGLLARRQQQFAADSFYKITNYDTVHRDLDLIGAWSPDLVILDEAQRIKNWNTRAARAVKRVSSPYALVLTGTPLENRLEELVSIVEFIDRHRLGPTFRFLHDHQVREDDSSRVIGYRDLEHIGKTLAPILIRRRKSEVLDQLPERLEKRFFVPMTTQQLKHHEENRETVARIVAKWRRYRFLSEADQRRLMIALQNMRMACDSTYLLDHTSDFGVKADEIATLLDEVFETADTKAVIFSQWVRMHELLVRRFEARKWDHVFFHGGVDSHQRGGLVDRFREDPRCRAFLSTDAGGVGLNLQHASVVINVDLPWNPAVLEQRIGRVHRLGQRRPVQVVNFVAQGTIEEGMLSLLGFKKSLFAGVLDGGENEVFLGGSRLTRFIESVEKVTSQIPVAAVEEPTAAVEEPATEAAGAAGVADEQTSVVAPLAGLLEAGAALLEQVVAALRAPAAVKEGTAGCRPLFETVQEPGRGERYLKLRMPPAEVVERVVEGVQTLLASLRRV